MTRTGRFLQELKRRRVYRAGVVYAAAAFAAAQAAELFLPRLGFPDWTVTLVVVVAAAGFPVAVVLAWVFEITPSGVRRSSALAPGEAAVAPHPVRLLAGSAVALACLGVGGWWASTVAFRSSPAVDRLAVLPLSNLMNDPGRDYFVRGMHDALISELAQVGIAVIARTSVAQYEGTRKRVREIAEELDVGAVVEGSVLLAGDSVRISVTLIDAASETPWWSGSYEGALRDVLALHGRVTSAVAHQIRQRLSPANRARLAAARPIDPRAYEAYLRGMSLLESGTPAGRESARHHFNAALAADSTFARAYLGLYHVWAGLRQGGMVPPGEATPRMREALSRALALDDGLADVHYALAAEATWTDWDWASAEASFRRALELNPNYARARAFHAHFLHIVQRPDEAMEEARRALELDPLNPLIHAIAGGAHLMAREPAAALERFRTVLRLSPGSQNGLIGVSNALHYAGRYDEALAAERENMLAGRGDAELAGALDAGYAEGGYRGAMRRAADLLVARAATQPVSPSRVSRLYLRGGEYERALDWLERGFRERDPTLPYISSGHQDFDPVRAHPRFRALLRAMGLPETEPPAPARATAAGRAGARRRRGLAGRRESRYNVDGRSRQ